MLTESNLVALLILSFIVHGWQYWLYQLKTQLTKNYRTLLELKTKQLDRLECDQDILAKKVVELIYKTNEQLTNRK
jgi:hypothetical protein